MTMTLEHNAYHKRTHNGRNNNGNASTSTQEAAAAPIEEALALPS